MKPVQKGLVAVGIVCVVGAFATGVTLLALAGLGLVAVALGG